MPSGQSAAQPAPMPEPNSEIEDNNDSRVKKEDHVEDDNDCPEEETIPVMHSLVAVPLPHLPPADSIALYLGQGSADSLLDPQLSAQGYIPHTELYSGLWSNVSSSLPCLTSNLTRPDQSGSDRCLARYPGNILATDHQPPRDRLARLQNSSAPLGSYQKGDEGRSRSQDDLRRSPYPLCQGLRHLHHGADHASLDPRRG